MSFGISLSLNKNESTCGTPRRQSASAFIQRVKVVTVRPLKNTPPGALSCGHDKYNVNVDIGPILAPYYDLLFHSLHIFAHVIPCVQCANKMLSQTVSFTVTIVVFYFA